MNHRSLAGTSDRDLLRKLAALASLESGTTAELLVHLAEVEKRQLFRQAGYPSMFEYCIRELHLSEGGTFRRIRAARAARKHPAIIDAVADGRLHLTAVVLLAPKMTAANAAELIAAATHKRKSEIELLLAHRFPQEDVPTRMRRIATRCAVPTSAPIVTASAAPCTELGAALMAPPSPAPTMSIAGPIAAEATASVDEQHAPEHVEEMTSKVTPASPDVAPARAPAPPSPATRIAPLSPQRFSLKLTMSQELHDKLRHAQELLSHQLPTGDVPEVLERALDVLISQLEKRKFAATDRPREQQRPSTAGSRYVPAHVKRTVQQRDGGRCTFVSDTGVRCMSRTFLEFDHVDEVARGGQASTDRMRQLCRAHNQLAAERTFGTEFMKRKRQEAGRRVADRAAANVRPEAEAPAATT